MEILPQSVSPIAVTINKKHLDLKLLALQLNADVAKQLSIRRFEDCFAVST